MEQQIATFEEVWPHLRPSGVYVTEDVLTSYWEGRDGQFHFCGGLWHEDSFVEYMKRKVDDLNALHWEVDANAADGLKLGHEARAGVCKGGLWAALLRFHGRR